MGKILFSKAKKQPNYLQQDINCLLNIGAVESKYSAFWWLKNAYHWLKHLFLMRDW